jgi:uncharacterized protein (TIGR02246 family)
MNDLITQSLKNMTDAFNAHDAQKFAANFTPDCVSTAFGMPMEMHGRDEIAKGLQTYFAVSSDAKGGAAQMFAKGNVVVVHWVSAGTMTGDFMGMKASKKPLGGHRLIVGTVGDDGLMTQTHDYQDYPGLMAQMKGAKDAPAVPSVPDTTEIHWAKNSPEEDKLVDWVKGFSDAFNKDDAKALSGFFAPEGEVTFQFLGGKVVKSGADLDKFHGDLFKAIGNAQFTVNGAWGIDGFAIAERTMTGKFKGKLGPVAPTNKDVTLHVCDIIQPTADGKVQHAWVFGNVAELSPPPPPKPAPAPKAAAPTAPGAPTAAAAPKAPDTAPKAADTKATMPKPALP